MIVLTTLNARYIHAAMGLRCLRANMGALEADTRIVEFIVQQPVHEIVERLLAHRPRIIGFGVYIWNAAQTERVVATLRQVAPEVVLVLGGPEVSHEWEDQPIVAQADHLITGAADLEFGPLCRSILEGGKPERVIVAEPPDPQQLEMPYRQYTQEDIDQRVIYVEASRGCPFKCEFCLSALDKTARPFDIDTFLNEMGVLYDRGVRHFKFVDRTFNLREDVSCRILDEFLDRLQQNPEVAAELFLHFEVIPDRLPDRLRERLARFPPGVLQLEVGIQTFNPEVQATISRRQDNERSKANLRWLRTETHAHLHVDLIAGLPGEELSSLADSFDQLVGLDPHEIQMGILKRLRGSVIRRHTESYGMVYDGYPPYSLLSNDKIDFADMQRISRFARFWDLIGNSGRFVNTRPWLLGDVPFERFMALSDEIYRTTQQTHQFALQRLLRTVHACAGKVLSGDPAELADLLGRDWQRAYPDHPYDPGDGKRTRHASAAHAARQQRHAPSVRR